MLNQLFCIVKANQKAKLLCTGIAHIFLDFALKVAHRILKERYDKALELPDRTILDSIVHNVFFREIECVVDISLQQLSDSVHVPNTLQLDPQYATMNELSLIDVIESVPGNT